MANLRNTNICAFGDLAELIILVLAKAPFEILATSFDNPFLSVVVKSVMPCTNQGWLPLIFVSNVGFEILIQSPIS